MMGLCKIDDLESPPVLGNYYWVPCYKIVNAKMPWIPIRGEMHSDGNLFPKTPEQHFHVDWRFANQDVFRFFNLSQWDWDDLQQTPFMVVNTEKAPFTVEYHRHLCWREDILYPLSLRENDLMGDYTGRYYRLHFREQLYRDFKGRSIEQGKCPHRGYNLASTPFFDEGKRKVCPLHGLTFDKEGKVVRHS